MTAPVRVIVVDDSPTMRGLLSAILNADRRLDVVAQAGDAFEARALIKSINPDVITLDIEMPRMSGLEFLQRVMRLRPMPVVMISSRTSKGSKDAIKAMSLGALDCIWKPDNPRSMNATAICDAVFVAANAQVHQRVGDSAPRTLATPRTSPLGRSDGIILIGASTGGVTALETLLVDLPEQTPPIVIAQHMPANFQASFASRLDEMLPHDVAMGKNGEAIKHGQIRLAPAGDLQTSVKLTSRGWVTRMVEGSGHEDFTPSVDHLFASAAAIGDRVTALMLTGLGNDGARAMKRLRDAGAVTFGQSADTCAVYGMPRAAKAEGAIMQELRIEAMASQVLAHLSSEREART